MTIHGFLARKKCLESETQRRRGACNNERERARTIAPLLCGRSKSPSSKACAGDWFHRPAEIIERRGYRVCNHAQIKRRATREKLAGPSRHFIVSRRAGIHHSAFALARRRSQALLQHALEQ